MTSAATLHTTASILTTPVADVTDCLLQETLRIHYPSVKGAKVLIDRLTGRTTKRLRLASSTLKGLLIKFADILIGLLIKVYSFVANLECYFCQTWCPLLVAIVVLFSFKFVGHLCDFPFTAMVS